MFGCISSDGYDDKYHHCVFNKNTNACQYGVAIGVIAFLACLLFLAVDAQFDSISNTINRRHLVTADLGFSSIWAFLWFVGFCFLADQWRKSTIQSQNVTNHARATIAFSFFSIFTWVSFDCFPLSLLPNTQPASFKRLWLCCIDICVRASFCCKF